MAKNNVRVLLVLAVLLLIAYFYMNGFQDYFTLDYMKSSLERFKVYDQAEPVKSVTVFFLTYLAAVALSLPGSATLLTLLAGALFGAFKGTVIVSFASSIGACLAFLLCRYVLHDWFQTRFRERFASINEGVERDGAFYLFSLRIIPIFPFFLVNIAMALTRIKLRTFYWVSQIGMLAGTYVYVLAGEELSKINSLKDIGNPRLLLAFSLLGIIPWMFKLLLENLKSRRAYKNIFRPKNFEYNTVVIGAGAAGLVSSYISAAVKARVALIESGKMGGDCLNYGCVPSKALIKSANIAHAINSAAKYGLISGKAQVDFKQVMARVKKIIQQVEPHDSIERYSKLGVDCFQGHAHVISPFEVEVNGSKLTTKNIIIASGAAPVVPTIPGLEKIKYYTSENIWELNELPKKFLIVGGGAIGCELAQCFQRLGSEVTVLERGAVLLGRSDERAQTALNGILTSEGVRILNLAELVEFSAVDQALIRKDGKIFSQEFSHVLFALGRKARTQNSGLDVLQLELNHDGTLKHNEFMQTRFPNIYVCGDVAGPVQLTHVASHQAWYAAVNALFSPFKKFKADYRVIPSVVFTDPEVAQVGLTSREAKAEGIAFEEITYEIDDLDRAICESEKNGFIKILTKPGSDRILGASIVGAHAGELIAEISLAMKWGLGLNKILGTVHSYPTWSEALKMTAGRWKQEHKPDALLKWIEKFHQFRRGRK